MTLILRLMVMIKKKREEQIKEGNYVLCANCIENWSQNREHRKLLIACRRYCYLLVYLFRLNLKLSICTWAEDKNKNIQNVLCKLRERARKYKVQSWWWFSILPITQKYKIKIKWKKSSIKYKSKGKLSASLLAVYCGHIQ